MFLPQQKDAVHKAWLFRVLKEIADDSYLVSVLRFKGGTCASMRNLLDRFSVDPDFDLEGEKREVSKVKKHLEVIFEDLGLEIKDKSRRAPQYFLRYPAKDSNRNNLKIDTFFPPLQGNKYEAVRLAEINRILYCQTIETMFANKLIALIDRFKKGRGVASRDLYDIHYFFMNGYGYDKNIVESYFDQSISDFLKELRDFIDNKITQKTIDQDLNFLIPPDKFQKIRKNLRSETLMFLRDEIKRVS
jgi:predicted nucleotidyltransferase component of viral defense system